MAKSCENADSSLDLSDANWGVTGLTVWRRHVILKRNSLGDCGTVARPQPHEGVQAGRSADTINLPRIQTQVEEPP